MIWLSDQWKEYKLLDCGSGEKLEQWGRFLLRRPEPQAIWPWPDEDALPQPDGTYNRSMQGGGHWSFTHQLPLQWIVSYPGIVPLRFYVKPMGFKHTGLFPEQATNWDWMMRLIQNANRPISVLNLFAYTGGATIACATMKASVCHVDAAKGIVSQAKENAALNQLENRPIRWIVDDCVKFVQREIRRGRHYDAIIMDPPSYGRGPSGEMWQLEDQLWALVKDSITLLSPRPLFILINTYTTGISPHIVGTVLDKLMGGRGKLSVNEIGLPIGDGKYALTCGCSARWEANF